MGYASLFEDINERFSDGELAFERFVRDNPYEEAQEIGAQLRTLLRECRESLNELRPIVELATDPGTDLAKENLDHRAQLDDRDREHELSLQKLASEHQERTEVLEACLQRERKQTENVRVELDKALREADVQRIIAEREEMRRRGVQNSAGLSDDEVNRLMEDY